MKQSVKMMKTTAMALLLSIAIPSQVLAAGSDTPTTSTKPKPEETCRKLGKVYNKETKKCEKKQAGLDQESIFESGRAYAYAGQYDEALAIFSLAPQQLDPRVLNMKGFSHRKLGNIEKGIAYYKHSIAIDPDYTLVREYYGEALLQIGDVAAAENQLDTIRAICKSEECEPYQQLFAAISDYKSGGSFGNSVSQW